MPRSPLSEQAQEITAHVTRLVLRHESTSDRQERKKIRRELLDAREDFRERLDKVPQGSRSQAFEEAASDIFVSLYGATRLIDE